MAENILQEADRITGGDRQQDYGSVIDDFGRTAALWSTIIGAKVTPEHVGLCMIALKISRQLHKAKRDNIVDIAGYARTLEKLEEETATRERVTAMLADD